LRKKHIESSEGKLAESSEARVLAEEAPKRIEFLEGKLAENSIE
jgi:hypothetical protein